MPSPQVTTRRATEADVPHILRFIRALAEYEKLEHQMVATEEGLRHHLFGPHPAAEAMIGAIDTQPVGYALFFTTFSTFLAKPSIWLEDLFVLPDHRSRGVGRALLRAVADIAIERDCGRLEWSVLDWNQPAIDFYHRAGAKILNDWRICRVTGEALQKMGASHA
ncbi:MAG TPA: GNAT family N-acetyltransferase [Tepidisphaeraceae bacterium]|nr:GNAT family N-acetyltransferase [Tepidisphaeraceae bacterium]